MSEIKPRPLTRRQINRADGVPGLDDKGNLPVAAYGLGLTHPSARRRRRRLVPRYPRTVNRRDTTGDTIETAVGYLSRDGEYIYFRGIGSNNDKVFMVADADFSGDAEPAYTEIFDATDYADTGSVTGVWEAGDGQLLVATNNNFTSEVSKITADATPATGGTFVIDVDGVDITVPYDADPDDFTAALVAAGFDEFDCYVTMESGDNLGEANAEMLLTWSQDLGGKAINVTADMSGLTGNAHTLTQEQAGSDDVTYTKLFRSSDWDPSNPGGQTWTNVLTSDVGSERFVQRWSIQGIYEDDPIVFVVPYGNKLKDGSPDVPRHAYLSRDHGQTFTEVFDLKPRLDGLDLFEAHTHSGGWDPYIRRLWVSVGDKGQSGVWISDDWGRTWTQTSSGSDRQLVTMFAFPEAVYAGPDIPNAVVRFWRDRHDADIAADVVDQIDLNPSITNIGRQLYQRTPDYPGYFAVPISVDNVNHGHVYSIHPQGGEIERIITDTRWDDGGIDYLVGPTASGRLICSAAGTISSATAREHHVYDNLPAWEEHAEQGLVQELDRFLRLTTGEAFNGAETPYDADLDAWSEIDVRVRVRFDDWENHSPAFLVGSWDSDGSANQQRWKFELRESGGDPVLYFWWIDDAGDDQSFNIGLTAAGNWTDLQNDVGITLRAVFNVDDGSNATCSFYYRLSDGDGWSLLADKTGDQSTIRTQEGPLKIGARNLSVDEWPGRVYYASATDENGDTIFDVDFTSTMWEVGVVKRDPADTAKPDGIGRLWTVRTLGARIQGQPRYDRTHESVQLRQVTGSSDTDKLTSLIEQLAAMGLIDDQTT